MPDDATSWIVEDILPSREVHILAGPSGSGKTTWLLQMVQEWACGDLVLGHVSYPTTFAYICCDRSAESMRRTLQRVRVDTDLVPIHSLRDLGLGEEPTLADLYSRFPDAHVLFLESMAYLVPGGKVNDYKTVAKFLEGASKLCQAHDVTIVGTTHTPKRKEEEGFANYREYILGSAAWGGFVETVMVMEPTDSKEEDERRRLVVLPRNSPKEEFEYYFADGGRLIESSQESATYLLGVELRTWTSNANITWKTLGLWMAKHDVSRRTVCRWIKHMIAQKKLERMNRGAWRPIRRKGIATPP